jgi:hypothetical protein
MVIAAFAWLAAPASAQVFVGRVDVAIQDATGAVLPGVTLSLEGPLNQEAVSDAGGEAHFLNLPPGTYTLKASLTGFNPYENRAVGVVAGGSVLLRIRLTVAGVTEAVDVEAASPTIDPKKQTTSTNVTYDELQNIPSSRDPWVVLQTVPSIIVDRVNVGGAESGQQSLFFGKGSGFAENTWNMDGIPITDMAATGATPTYYDFDMFQEMQVTTGGGDVQNPTPGVQLNFVLKTGSNTPHGSARYYFANEDLQSTNLSSALAAAIGGTTKKGNRTEQYADYGVEAGGPVVKDKWWVWGSYGKTDVRIRTLNNVLDRTVLDNRSFKTQAQVTDGFRPSFTYFRGDKIKDGRGASPTRPTETTWDQSGPTNMYKGEANFVVGSNLFLVGKYSYIDGAFQLIPKGGFDQRAYLDDSGVWHNTFFFYQTNRPQHAAILDGNLFRGRHEIKFGLSWRKAIVESVSGVPGGIYTVHIGYPDLLPVIYRDWAGNTNGRYIAGYVGDTWSANRLTLNLGVRYDHQSSSVDETSVGASPILPSLLPALTAPAISNAVVYKAFSPRVGITYALDENRKTQLRASYALFSSQLGAAQGGIISTIQYSGIYYYAVDLNGNRVADNNEILFNLGNVGYYGFDPANPTKLDSVNEIEDYTTPKTHEFLVGLDRELMPNFSVNGTFTFRRFNSFNWFPRIGVRSNDYLLVGRVTGSDPAIGSFDEPFYRINPAAVPPGGGREFLERDGYRQRYWGFEVSATKRMSDRWMARFGFSTNDHREYFEGANSIEDPTRTPNNPLVDGGVVVTQTGGSGKSAIFLISPKYQFIANGLYQGPWGINFGGNLLVRQGFGQPFFQGRVATGDVLVARKSVLLVQDLSDNRLPTVTSLDVRVEKAFTFDRWNVIFDVDIFNLGNRDTVLGRQYDRSRTGTTGFNQVLEIMNPRIVRLGLRFTF